MAKKHTKPHEAPNTDRPEPAPADRREAPDADELDRRNIKELNDALALAQHTVYKQYLDELSAYPLAVPGDDFLKERPEDHIRAFRLERLTHKKGEDPFQKLSTVYHAAMSMGCSLFVMVDVPSPADPVKIYLGVRDPSRKYDWLKPSYEALRDGLLSNFPGSEPREISATGELGAKLDEIFGDSASCVASVSCVASARDKARTEHKSFIQGIEKLIDTMQGSAAAQGSSYTALFIAEPVSPREQGEIRSGYESLYSALSSFRKSVWSYSETDSHSVMETLTHGISATVTEGSSHTQSHTLTRTRGSSDSLNIGLGGNLAKAKGKAGPTKAARAGNLLTSIGGTVTSLIEPAATLDPVLGAVAAIGGPLLSAAGSLMQGGSVSESITKSLGLNAGYGHTFSRSTSVASGSSDTETRQESKGESSSTAKGTTDASSSGRSLQIENTNKTVEELLKRVEEQLRRTRESEDYGSYSCAAYFLSSKEDISLLAANTYRALMLGEGSAVERGAVNFWRGRATDSESEKEIVRTIKEYLRRFAHPVFALPLDENASRCLPYSPGTVVSGLELPLHLGLPTRSVPGLPVISHAEFGRNVPESDDPLPLGRLFHMGQDGKCDVCLDMKRLTGHTFLTGSTGAGKSNAVYHILDGLGRRGVAFLVIEPAKGEYKQIFGAREDVAVYGTNAAKAPLLRLNPFSFPEDVHVLEHIDRLVEIFNACWPMYAAMPAVLKDAIEEAYRSRGWDLSASRSAAGTFPSFSDLLEEIPLVMERSSYSNDTRSDYVGSLVTRVRSLTNGINGQIFRPEGELGGEELFERNVIVDLSRVGSTETKALLMGILVMKLQEYRLSSGRMNARLRHLTVLEEAHNLLRRCSDAQSQDSSNLQGKSVEMLANAIAELRTYGEGFLIADQAPGLMDPSAIRNTNTKLILRLPDEADRRLAGRAASLNDAQIEELARLPLGVAAVYQNGWQEPVLCRIDRFEGANPFEYSPGSPAEENTDGPLHRFYCALFGVKDGGEMSAEDVDAVKRWIGALDEAPDIKAILRRAHGGEALTETERGYAAYNLFGGRRLCSQLEDAEEADEGIRSLERQLLHAEGVRTEDLAGRIRQYILRAVLELDDMEKLRRRFEAYITEGGIL